MHVKFDWLVRKNTHKEEGADFNNLLVDPTKKISSCQSLVVEPQRFLLLLLLLLLLSLSGEHLRSISLCIRASNKLAHERITRIPAARQ